MRLDLSLVDFEVALNQTLIGNQVLGVDKNWNDLVWTPFNDRVRKMEIVRGRKDPRFEFQAGQMTLNCDNSDGALDPRVTGGEFSDETTGANLWKLNTPVRARLRPGLPAPFGSNVLFTGVLGTTPISRDKGGDSEVAVQCVDMVKFFSQCPLSGDLPEERTGERIWRILNMVTFPPASLTFPYHRLYFDTMGQSRVVKTRLAGHIAQEHISHCLRTEGLNASGTIAKSGAFGFIDRHWLGARAQLEPRGYFGTGISETPYLDIRWNTSDQDILNQIEISIEGTSEPRSFTVITTASSPILASASILPVEPIRYDLPVDTTLDFGLGRLVTLSAKAKKGEFGLFVDPMLIDIPAGSSAQYNANLAIVGDNASQLKHGKRKFSRNTLLPSIEDAYAMGADILAEYVDPRVRCELLKLDGTDPEQARECIDRYIGDIVSVRDKAFYQSMAAGILCSVQGVKHTAVVGDWDTELYTTPAPLSKDPWTWNDADVAAAVWGTSTNLIF